jgi:hypothetical protein
MREIEATVFFSHNNIVKETDLQNGPNSVSVSGPKITAATLSLNRFL